MNALNRRITPGEHVVMSTQAYRGDERARTLIARSGYGLSADTAGTAIIGEWLDGSGTQRVCGRDLDPVATAALARSE